MLVYASHGAQRREPDLGRQGNRQRRPSLLPHALRLSPGEVRGMLQVLQLQRR